MSVNAESSHEINHDDQNEEKYMPNSLIPSVGEKPQQPTVPRVHIRNMPNESLLLQMVSGGLALRGIRISHRKA